MTRRLNSAIPIVGEDGTIEQDFRDWANRVSDNLLLVGTGSPEGVIDAPQYSLYVDEAVPLVPVQYRKMLPEVGGDTKQGWAAL